MIQKHIKPHLFLVYLLALFIGAGSILSAQVGTVVAVTGKVVNEIDKTPTKVKITVFDENGKKINKTKSNSKSGYYYITGLKSGRTYIYRLEYKGFMTEECELKIPNTSKYMEISKDFMVKPAQSMVKIPMAVPPFELNKSKLRFGAAFILENIKNTLMLNPDINFTILCYPDNNKDVTGNTKLTEARANSIKEFLVVQGIMPERINLKFESKTDPNNPPPVKKTAKGKRYIGSTYIEIN